MNARFFMIGAAVFLLLVGIGSFLAYKMNGPVQQVRIYEVPDKSDSPLVVAPATTVKTETVDFGQQGQISDTATIQYSAEYDQVYEDTAQMAESTIEPCCPDELYPYPVGDIDFRQDTNLDHNPVSPEVITDSKLRFEYMKALKAFDEKYLALDAEISQLEDEFKYLISLELDKSLLPKLEAWQAKYDALMKKREELNRQEPVYPTSTHRH